MAPPKTKVLLAKVGLDGHDTGIRVLTEALRDAGMEVVYLGVHNPPERVVRAALEEDVQVIGLGFHCFDHLIHTPRVLEGLRRQGALGRVQVVLGGIIPKEDYPRLKEMGVSAIFGPGTPQREIVDFISRSAI